jgi:hypothetical protein
MSVHATKAWRRQRRRRGSSPSIEVLETRIAMAPFFVVNALDGPGPGPAGSLRSAITQATQASSGGNRVVITSSVTTPIDLTAGEISIPTSLAIVNEAGRAVDIRQTELGARVFDIGTGASKVTMSGENPSSPITVEGGSLTSGSGGGILVSERVCELAFVISESPNR